MPISKIFQTAAMQLEAGRSETLKTCTFQAEADDDILTTSAQTFVTGDAGYVVKGAGDLPNPIVALTLYYVIVINTTHIKLAVNRAHAIAGVAINITTDGGAANVFNVTGVASEGWGDAASAATLGANDAFPYLSFSSKLAIALEEDASVTTKGFKALPRMIGKSVDNPLSFYGRYAGMNRFHYWMFGFEHDPKSVYCFKGTGFATAPTVGVVYVQSGKNYTYLRTETYRSGMSLEYIFVFSSTEAAPTVAGELTSDGKPTFTYTSVSAKMYEHTYEIDSGARHFRAYTAAEDAVLTSVEVTDKRNLMATIGKRSDGYDIRYQNSICKGFNYKIAAAGLASFETNFLAYSEARDDYSSSAWTLLSGLGDNQLVPAHFEHMVLIGTAYAIGANGQLNSMSELGISNLDIGVGIPLQSMQDFVSGLSIAEPIIENAYDIKINGTISRHSSQVYQTYRDAQTPIILRVAANQGWYMQEWLVKTAILSEAGMDDSGVAQEVLAINPGYVEGSHQWTTWLTGVTEIHKAPIVFRTRDYESVNQMTAQ